MAKLTTFATLFAALIVIASATTYTKQGQWSAVADPQYSEEHLDECCDQLRSISSQCRCDAIRGMMMDMQQTYGMEKMRKMAESLPQMCNMEFPSECRMRAVYF